MSEILFSADLHLGHKFMAGLRGFGREHLDTHDGVPSVLHYTDGTVRTAPVSFTGDVDLDPPEGELFNARWQTYVIPHVQDASQFVRLYVWGYHDSEVRTIHEMLSYRIQTDPEFRSESRTTI